MDYSKSDVKYIFEDSQSRNCYIDGRFRVPSKQVLTKRANQVNGEHERENVITEEQMAGRRTTRIDGPTDGLIGRDFDWPLSCSHNYHPGPYWGRAWSSGRRRAQRSTARSEGVTGHCRVHIPTLPGPTWVLGSSRAWSSGTGTKRWVMEGRGDTSRTVA